MADSSYFLSGSTRASFAPSIIVTGEQIHFHQRRAVEDLSQDEWLQTRAAEWREFWDKLPGERPIKHDPEWRNRFWSIQNAHDGNTFVWKAAHSVTKTAAIIGLGAPGILVSPFLLPLLAMSLIACWPKQKDDQKMKDDIAAAEASRRAYQQKRTELNGLRNLIGGKDLITGPKVSQDA